MKVAFLQELGEILNEHTYQPKKCSGFIIEELDGELVLFNPMRNLIIHANQTAALIWQLCDGERTIPQIVDLLSEAYPEAQTEIKKEAPLAIQDLHKKGALEGG